MDSLPFSRAPVPSGRVRMTRLWPRLLFHPWNFRHRTPHQENVKLRKNRNRCCSSRAEQEIDVFKFAQQATLFVGDGSKQGARFAEKLCQHNSQLLAAAL
jgi:hypothetical protein